MSAAQRISQISVIDTLFSEPAAFEFFQAVRLLQRHLKHTKNIDAEKALNDFIQFNATLSLAFQKSELESLVACENNNGYILIPSMIGLTGNLGALPLVYTQKLNTNSWAKKNGSTVFLDLFNNRLINLFYKASIQYNLPLLAELKQDKHYLDCIHALSGISPRPSIVNNKLISQVLAEFGGLLQGQMLNAESIQQLLSAVLKQPVIVHQFIPEWFTIPNESRNYLSAPHIQLGLNTFCGERVKQIDSKIQLEIGPLDYVTYLKFLPEGEFNKILRQLLKKIISFTTHVEVVLVIDKNQVRNIQLNQKNINIGLAGGAFLVSRPLKNHQSQTRFII